MQRLLELREYCIALKTEQEKVLLSGGFNRIEEYKAACTVLRNFGRVVGKLDELIEKERKGEDDE